jgi:hypothetical protein
MAAVKGHCSKARRGAPPVVAVSTVKAEQVRFARKRSGPPALIRLSAATELEADAGSSAMRRPRGNAKGNLAIPILLAGIGRLLRVARLLGASAL